MYFNFVFYIVISCARQRYNKERSDDDVDDVDDDDDVDCLLYIKTVSTVFILLGSSELYDDIFMFCFCCNY